MSPVSQDQQPLVSLGHFFSHDLTPKEIVSALDKHVIGQPQAKRAVANAIRNRMRRLRVPLEMQREISPKNILMIGSTGIGKTEIARRLAMLIEAPFVKVEATKFTEVGYVGKDVDSIIRDLVEDALHKVRAKALVDVRVEADKRALERVETCLKQLASLDGIESQDIQARILAKEFDHVEIEFDVQSSMGVEIMVPHGMEEVSHQLQNLFQSVQSERSVKRKMNVEHAMKFLQDEESHKLINEEDIKTAAVKLAGEQGIVFIDEIDKVVRSNHHGDVSREGVQRDLLPLLDGTVVNTRYGNISTDFILFIAAGAFMNCQPTDMLSELQGRLPIQVKLQPLVREDFIKILRDPENSLIKQYQALLKTEAVDVVFTEDALDTLADFAVAMNAQGENIGARRLQTIMEMLMDDLSFTAEAHQDHEVVIDRAYVEKYVQMGEQSRDADWIL